VRNDRHDPSSRDAIEGRATEELIVALLNSTGALLAELRPDMGAVDNLEGGDIAVRLAWGDPSEFSIESKWAGQPGGHVCVPESTLSSSRADVVALVSYDRKTVAFVPREMLLAEAEHVRWSYKAGRASAFKLIRIHGSPRRRMDVDGLIAWARDRKKP
jgi:hypothetical protein